jgi:adenylyl cyclase-associated protein
LESAAVSGGGAGAGGAGGAESGASIEGFDEIINGPLKTFMDNSAGVGGDVATGAAYVKQGFDAQRAFLVQVSQCKKPSDTVFQSMLTNMSAAITACNEFKDGNRKSKQFNHLSGMAEALPALGWVAMSPKPCPFIKDTSGGAQFYTNRVIKEFKESDPAQVTWARSLIAVLTDLEAYVKANHTTGPSWNPKGGEAKGAAPAQAAPKPAAAVPKVAPAGAVGALKTGLFSELSKGEGVTSGLKKVDRSQMTHKNPELRGSSVVPASAAKKPAAAPAKKFGAAAAVKKDPVLELQGKKWVVEHQEGNKEIVIEAEGVNQTLYAYRCNNSTIQVKGKINAIALDSCKKTAIVFETCVAAFELVNCQSVQVQVTGKCATISIDKTDGALVYLSKECLDVDIVSAKSSEMNISVPDENGEFTEYPVPEQYKTTYNQKTKKLHTEPTDIAG